MYVSRDVYTCGTSACKGDARCEAIYHFPELIGTDPFHIE